MHPRFEWHHPLFAHYRIPVASVELLLPPHLTLDRFAGEAFLSLVAVEVVGPLPLPRYRQVSLRTCVVGERGPGIWVLDAWVDKRAPLVARAFGLPYRRMHSLKVAAGVLGALVSSEEARLEGVRAGAAVQSALVDFLVERSWIYAVAPTGRPWAARIEHAPWVLDEVAWRTVGTPLPTLLREADGPLLGHVARDLEVRVVELSLWPRRRPIPRLQAEWA